MFTMTAWSNGSGFYGLRVAPADRAQFFRESWDAVQIVLPGRDKVIQVPLTPSFWISCPELRSSEITKWLRASGLAPWPPRKPPKLRISPMGGATFAVDLKS
jgi:hypothetical protein